MSTSKKISIAAIGMAAMVALMVGLVFGQDHPQAARGCGRTGKVALAKPVAATVTGQNFCLGCSLKKEHGAGAQCSIYGHKHALRVTKAVAGNKELPEMRGWVLHYLGTEKSQDLINKGHGENLTVIGKVYPNERVLEVTSYKKAAEPEAKAMEPT